MEVQSVHASCRYPRRHLISAARIPAEDLSKEVENNLQYTSLGPLAATWVSALRSVLAFWVVLNALEGC